MIDTSFKCECGQIVEFPAEVFNEWSKPTRITCHRCQRRYEICYGQPRWIDRPHKDHGVPVKEWLV